MLKKILSYVGKYKKESILSPLSMIGEVAMEVTIPLVMAAMVDKGINGDGGTAYVLKMGALMVVMALFSLFCGSICAKLASTASMGFGANLRKGLFDKITQFSFSNVDHFSQSSLITRLTTDVSNIQNAYQMVIRMCVRSPMMFIFATIMAVALNAKLSLIFLVAIPVLLGGLLLIARKVFPLFDKMFKKYDRMNSVVQENLTGIRVVKSYVREDFEIGKFNASAEDVFDTSVRAEKLMILTSPLMQFAMYCSNLAIAWFGAKFIIAETMTTGELISYVSYGSMILSSLMMVSFAYVMVIMARASMKRLCEILDEKIDIQDEGCDKELKVPDGSVVFENVGFSYSGDTDNLILQNIDLKIKSGEKIGILGATGSAKTSFVQLIPRLYDVQQGRVLVGGRDVRDYPLKELRDSVAMVLQKNLLFSGSIADNLRWGNMEASDEELINACKDAQAHDFITGFPDGYETHIEQGGSNVSGGQKQRICIARALLKKPKILILDDSTSAVDTATDAKIRKAFRENQEDVTVFIIAQRINSISDCDRIIVLEQGRVNGFGTHEELLRSNKIYQEVYESQQKGGDE